MSSDMCIYVSGPLLTVSKNDKIGMCLITNFRIVEKLLKTVTALKNI